MSLKFKCIAALAFLIVEFYVLSTSTRLNIERGDQDTFENPNCESSTQNSRCKCDDLNADCMNSSCKTCRCSSTYATFLSSNGKNGRCVKNRRLLFISAFSSSFLAQNVKCLIPAQLNELKGISCDASEEKQHWIWTRNDQLMHVDTLKCLQLGEQSENGHFWRIVLEECKNSERKQLLRCLKGQLGQIVYLKNSTDIKLYMTKEHSVWGTTYNIQSLTWTRYQSAGKSLCSKASGCYGFGYPHESVIWEIDCLEKSCHGERKIATPAKLGKNLCFMMWKKLQYLDNDKWKQLLFKDEIFTIGKRSDETFLKLNFKEATNDWSGLIIKLHFYCADEKLTQVNATDINCIVIKFKGTAIIYLPTLPSTVSTTDTTIIANYSTTSTSMTSSTDTLVHLARAAENNKNNSSHVTIIALCVVIAILILGAGILGLIFYKQTRCRPSANKEGESHAATGPSEDITNPIYATIDIYETPPFSGEDKIYQEPQIGLEPGECEVYESIDDKYRDCTDIERNAQEDAKGGDVHPVAQRLPVEDQLPDAPRDASDAQSEEKVLNGKDKQSSAQCHIYHTLEELKFDG